MLDDLTASGGGSEDIADDGEGDGVVATLAGGDDSIVNNSVLGIESFERNDVGVYQMTLEDKYFDLKSLKAMLLNASANDIQVQMVSQSVSGTRVIVFHTLTSATPTDPAVGAVMFFKLELKNSSAV